MKKWWMLVLVFIVFVLVACQINETKKEAVVKTNKQGGTVENNVIDVKFFGVENINRINEFSKRVSAGKKDKIRIIQHTIEGDPVYQDIKYDGDVFHYTFDPTEDKFGGTDLKVEKTTCKDFDVTEKNTETTAMLTQCEGRGQIELFQIEYNSAKEDRFDFTLKYGEDLEKVIDSSNGNWEPKEKNIVFKQLVYTNEILTDKYNSTCNDSNVKYELTVWLNGSEKHITWGDCDTSNKAEKYNEIAKTIIQVNKTLQ